MPIKKHLRPYIKLTIYIDILYPDTVPLDQGSHPSQELYCSAIGVPYMMQPVALP